VFFFSSRRRHTRSKRDWSSDVCSSDLTPNRQFELADDYELWPIAVTDVSLFATQYLVKVTIRLSEEIKKFVKQVIVESPIEDNRSEERRVGKECRARRGG